MKIEHNFLEFFSNNNIPLKKSFLLAISGGVDSITLLKLFHKYKIKSGVAHCNFSLRKESNDDQKFVERLSQENEFKLFVKRFDIDKEKQKTTKSIQMIARESRYAWLQKVAHENKYDYIVTAHHLNDNIETILLNLFHGTGIAGLRGILPVIKGSHIRGNPDTLSTPLIRPFIHLTKKDILSYAQRNNISWKEDKTNKVNYYKRNFVRNAIVPLIKKINPNLEQTFELNIHRFLSIEKLLRQEIKNIKEKILLQKGNRTIIKYQDIKNLEWKNLILYDILKDFNFSYKQVEEIKNNFRQRGKIFISKSYKLVYDKNLILVPLENNKNFEKFTVQENLHILNIDTRRINFEIVNDISNYDYIKNKNIQSLNYDKLKFPLVIRKWVHGDKFKPLGMVGFQKLSDFFINKKISILEKEDILVLLSDGDIACILNYQIDDRYKIDKTTERIFRIEVKKLE